MADARYRQIHPSEKGSLKDDFIRLMLQYNKKRRGCILLSYLKVETKIVRLKAFKWVSWPYI